MPTTTLRSVSDLAHRFDVAYDHVLSHFVGDIIYFHVEFHVESFRAPIKAGTMNRRSYRLMDLAEIADFFIINTITSPQATHEEMVASSCHH